VEHEGMISWVYGYALEQLFAGDKRKMALGLRVSERTLDIAMNQVTSAQSMLLFELLFGYMNERGISMDNILTIYLKERG